MTIPAFDETLLSHYASFQVIQRGSEYFHEGAVGALIRRGAELEADVQGNAPRPYRVWVEFDAEGVTNATCTCPYEHEGWCKHIVAVLLAYARNPEQVEIRTPLAESLDALDRAQLQALLLELADRIPRMTDLIEAALPYVTLATATPAGSAAPMAHPAAAPNVQSLRYSVRNAMRSRNDDWDDSYAEEGDGVVDAIVELAEQARPRLDAGDSRAALAILEAVTDEFRKHWQVLDETGEDASAFFDAILPLWSEALLDPDLSTTEREHWAQQLADWTDDFDESVATLLNVLQTIVRQGWNESPLRRILQGEYVPGGLWGDDPPPYAQETTLARLRILERTGQDAAYLNLSKAERLHQLYALYLLKRGHIQEAIAVGLEQPLSSDERLELARALHERGERMAALEVAEKGLQQPETAEPEIVEELAPAHYPAWMNELKPYDAHPQGELAAWLRDRAAECGEIDRALAAGIIAFRFIPSFIAYQRVETLAGESWPALRPDLLDFLRQKARTRSEIRVDIFLHERLIDDAIQAVDQSYVASSTLERVMDAAIACQPQWVIDRARQQAEPIMDGAKSAHYAEAVRWLGKIRLAYQALDQEAEWRRYLDALREKHQRKYKLMPMLAML